MTPQRHSVVVGAGAGGLAMALLLARAGRRVTLLEATPRLGGSLQRFVRGGIPFDTGFHFTGGMDGVLRQMLAVLGIDDLVREEPLGNRIYLAETGRMVVIPSGGMDKVCDALCTEFPGAAGAVREYCRRETWIMEHTPLADLRDRDLGDKLALNEYDFVSLDQFLDRIGATGEVRAVLAAAAMCHGSAPSECPLTHHSRVSFGLNDHIARIARGGDGFLDGFRREAAKLPVEVRTQVTVAECLEWSGRECRRVRLSDGEELTFDDMFLAIHPRAIAELLPEAARSRSFRAKVDQYQDSCGFFTVWGVLRDGGSETAELTSFLSCNDLNRMLLPGGGGHGTGIVRARERTADGRTVTTLTAFRSVFPEDTLRWSEAACRRDEESYRAYKRETAARVIAEIETVYPEYRGRADYLESASMLSFRDYLPPAGCAYGVRRKVGENHLFGRLPVRNFYALGQSALAPGVVGTMMSSFLLFRQLVGEERYFAVIGGIL